MRLSTRRAILMFLLGSLLLGSTRAALAAPPDSAAAPVSQAKDRQAAANDKATSLRDYIAQSQGRYAYGLYLKETKVGYSIDDLRLGKYQGRPVALVDSEGRMEMVVRGQKSTFGWKQLATYDLDGDGLAARIEETTRDDDRATTTTATREQDKLLIKTKGPGGATERRVPMPKENLALMRRLDQWLSSVNKPGETFKYFSTTLDESDIDKPQQYSFLSRRPFRWGGVATQLTHVRMVSDGANYEMDLLPDGAAIKGKLGPFDMRLEEELTARNLKAAVFDMSFEVPLDRLLGDPRRVDSLTLEFRGLGDFQFPTNAAQTVRKEDDGATIVTLTRQHRTGEPHPLSDDERKASLRETPAIQSDSPEVKKLAASIVGAERDPLKQAEALRVWVHSHLRQTYQANATTALEVLSNRAGDCTEHTLLFVSLARAAGLPAREVGGLVYDESAVVAEPARGRRARAAAGARPTFGWHAWAEIHDGTQWVSVDPTWNETYVDATHIMLSVGTQDFAWLNVLGKLTVKVRDFKTQ